MGGAYFFVEALTELDIATQGTAVCQVLENATGNAFVRGDVAGWRLQRGPNHTAKFCRLAAKSDYRLLRAVFRVNKKRARRSTPFFESSCLNDAVGKHGVSNFSEARNVSALHVVDVLRVIGVPVPHAFFMNAVHDCAQLFLEIISLPR